MKNAPPKIFLQVSDLDNQPPTDFNTVDRSSVTWCEDRCFPNDVEYISRQEVEAMLQVFKAQIVVMLLDGAIDVDSVYEAYENIKQPLK